MKGIYNNSPSLPKRSFIWDPGVVVKYLGSIFTKSLFDISRKLVSLLKITRGQRGNEIYQ